MRYSVSGLVLCCVIMLSSAALGNSRMPWEERTEAYSQLRNSAIECEELLRTIFETKSIEDEHVKFFLMSIAITLQSISLYESEAINTSMYLVNCQSEDLFAKFMERRHGIVSVAKSLLRQLETICGLCGEFQSKEMLALSEKVEAKIKSTRKLLDRLDRDLYFSIEGQNAARQIN